MSNDRIYLSPPFMGGDELNEIKKAFADNWIAPVGPHINQFETTVAQYCGTRFAVALSSGTAAIHLALIILGVKQEDEVICSSFTFAGSCNPILYQKAIPVFVDSEKDTWNMCPDTLKECIEDRISKGKKPKAIIAVHLYGNPAKMNEILSIASEYEIPVIEDAAEGVGSEYHGKKLGSLGDIGILSFNGNKLITTSGGGMLITNKQPYAEKTKFLSTQALDKVDSPYYQHSELGFNYRLSNISAAIGVGQMKILDSMIEKTRQINTWYREFLSDLEFLTEQPDTKSNYWLTTCLLDHDKVKRVINSLEKQNIESRHVWKPMHMQPLYKEAPFYSTGVSADIFRTGICLPSGGALTREQVEMISNIIKMQL